MIAFILVGLLTVVDDDLVRERSKFVGDWTLVETIHEGKVEQEAVGSKTVYSFKADGTYMGLVGDSTVGKGTYRPIPGSKPAAVNWTAASRQEFDGKFSKEHPSVGIYRFKSGMLEVALKLEGKTNELPKDFMGKGDELVLRLKRGK